MQKGIHPNYRPVVFQDAAANFETINRSNKFAILFRIQDAKKPETRAARIEKFVAMLARGEKLF